MRYFIIAGERSGDLHGASLVRQIKVQDTEAQVQAYGGDLMLLAGAELVSHYRDMSFMGFWEVIKNLNKVRNKLQNCKRHITAFRPDVVILIDFPGFNLRMARFAKLSGIKVVYYISPKIWAWKKSRIKQIKAYVDKMFAIFPFEVDFYDSLGYPVHYVGNPLVESIASWSGEKIPSKKPTIGFLPGSREQEVRASIPIIRALAQFYKDYHLIIAGVDNVDPEFYEELKGLQNVSIFFDRTYSILHSVDVAVVTSGTATLEAALLKVPQVVCYKTSFATYWIARLFLKIRFISLVNLIAGQEVVKELIQGEYNLQNLKNEIDILFRDNERRQEIKESYDRVENLLGSGSSSMEVALEIKRLLSGSS
ncbi:MAG: lipid-A-disaccharide synthase [Cyclobacteriaceae bacterium]|nr:lipid-A-disaccharide synthase [Cyclobacteriaceae bacterium HetDA_MAG_MS6]